MQVKNLYENIKKNEKPFAHKTILVTLTSEVPIKKEVKKPKQKLLGKLFKKYTEYELIDTVGVNHNTYVIDNSMVGFEIINNNEVLLTIYNDKIGKNIEPKLKFKEIIVDVTDDPTPDVAGGVVSLGYYVNRFAMKEFKIMSLTPQLVLSTNLSNFLLKNTKSMRTRIQYKGQEVIPIKSSLPYEVDEKLREQIKTYEHHLHIYNKNTNEYSYIIRSLMKKDVCQIIVQYNNQTSMFSDVVLMEHINCEGLEQLKQEEVLMINKYTNKEGL